MPPAPRPTRTIRRARRWLVLLGVGLVLAASVLAVVAVGLARMAPPWWRTVRPDDPAAAEAAESVENDIVNAAYRVRPELGEAWAVALRARDANAWLNTRLEQWLVNADPEFVWPDELHDLQVEFDAGRVHIGVSVRDGERSQFFSATLRPEIREDGSLWAPVESMFLGRLPIPTTWVVERAGEHWPAALPSRVFDAPAAPTLLAVLSGEAPLRRDPSIDLGDGRWVRLVGIAPEEGLLRVTCRTEYEE